MPILSEIIHALEQFAPPHLAEDWDNVGLMVGDPNWPVKRVLCALDINEQVVEEAIRLNANCIVSHHPFIFKAIKRIDLSQREGRMIQRLISNQIAVYGMHTNYDVVEGGLNDYLAKGLGLTDIEILSVTHEEKLCKCIIYVPITHYEIVRQCIIDNNVRHIGNYKGCTFSCQGEGSFIPLKNSNPYLGKQGEIEIVKECQISFLIEQHKVATIMDAVKKVHPYEEVAYDVFLAQNILKQSGIGRVGSLKAPTGLEELIQKVKDFFDVSYVRVNSVENNTVKRIAICSGSGAQYIQEASQKADVYITGDIKFHEAQRAKELGLILIDVGHYASEHKALQPIVDDILEHFDDCEVILSKVDGETLMIR